MIVSKVKDTQFNKVEVNKMLSDLTSKELITLNVEASDWEDAIRKSAIPLVNYGKVKPEYVDEIIRVVKETGPYIVITKHVALPHARSEAGAIDSAIGIATLTSPIEFHHEENDPVKYVFVLSAKDNGSHISALADLVGLLELDEFYQVLDNAKDPQEVIDFIIKIENL